MQKVRILAEPVLLLMQQNTRERVSSYCRRAFKRLAVVACVYRDPNKLALWTPNYNGIGGLCVITGVWLDLDAYKQGTILNDLQPYQSAHIIFSSRGEEIGAGNRNGEHTAVLVVGIPFVQ